MRRELARLAREAVDVSDDLYNVGQADRPDVLEVIEAERGDIDLARAENDLERAEHRAGGMMPMMDMCRAMMGGHAMMGLGMMDRRGWDEPGRLSSASRILAEAEIERRDDQHVQHR